jgi:hypothetical protein
MKMSFDLYAPDYVSGGDPYFVQTLHREGALRHLLSYLEGFSKENNDYIVKNLQVYP